MGWGTDLDDEAPARIGKDVPVPCYLVVERLGVARDIGEAGIGVGVDLMQRQGGRHRAQERGAVHDRGLGLRP